MADHSVKMVILLYRRSMAKPEMEEQRSRKENAHVETLMQAVADRNAVACQRSLKQLEASMQPDDVANLITEVMAILAPLDFGGTLWLLEALDHKQPQDLQALLSQEPADRYAAFTPQTTAPTHFLAAPNLLILTSIGAYALGLDPNAQTGIVLIHAPTGEPIQVFEDEVAALDAMIALDNRENLHKRDERVVTGHDKRSASPWML
jgi:hypothetical protein